MGSRQRRVVSITAVSLALPLALLLLPGLMIGAAIADATGRLFRFPSVRLVLFGVVYLINEWIGLALAAAMRAAELLGLFHRHEQAQAGAYRRIQAWWVSSLQRWARRLLGVRFDLDNMGTLPQSGFILLSRHASMVDAVLPALMVAKGSGRFVHYVLKRELQWDPILDIYGRRLGNYFVARNGQGEAEAEAISKFALASRPNAALVIFPEGAYSTPARQEQIRASLARKGQEKLAEFANELQYLLPPKPAGTLSVLEGQPELDVVIVGHVGLEGVTDAGLRRRLPLRDPVIVRWWVRDRETVPTSSDDRIAWLNDEWRTLDRWVAEITNTRVP